MPRNIIKGDGGTGKLIGLPRLYYYIFDSYEFTINGFNFYVNGPIQELSTSEKNILSINNGYKSTFSKFILTETETSISPPVLYYQWLIFYFNFNDLEDASNGLTLYNSNSSLIREKLEDITQWNNAVNLQTSITPYAFNLIGRFPTRLQIINSLASIRNGVYDIKYPDIITPYPMPPIYEKKNELGVVVSTISSYYYNNSVIFYIDSYDTNTGYFYYNETIPIDFININKSNIYPYQINSYSNYFDTNNPSILNDPNIQVIELK